MSDNDTHETSDITPLYEVQDTYAPTESRSSLPWVPILLFGLTLVTTTLTYAMLTGGSIGDLSLLYRALPFSLTLLVILGIHEFGHYFASKSWGVRTTLPYFIPFIPGIGIGTFGAIIKTKSRIPDKRALLDIGVAGPLAGFVAAFLASIIGLRLSEVVSMPSTGGGSLILGDSLLFSFLAHIIWGELPPGQDILLHPMAFAGWLGFLVTTLNLFPIGQLDGGHIVFAMWGRKQRYIATTTLGLAVGLGVFRIVSPVPWLLFCGIAVAFTGITHPPVYNPYVQLDKRRKAIGYLAFLVFLLCFAPVPISM